MHSHMHTKHAGNGLAGLLNNRHNFKEFSHLALSSPCCGTNPYDGKHSPTWLQFSDYHLPDYLGSIVTYFDSSSDLALKLIKHREKIKDMAHILTPRFLHTVQEKNCGGAHARSRRCFVPSEVYRMCPYKGV